MNTSRDNTIVELFELVFLIIIFALTITFGSTTLAGLKELKKQLKESLPALKGGPSREQPKG